MAKIQYAGFQSNKINIRRGVRQGCPLSPLLFNLVIKLLGLAVRQNPEIHGVLIEQMEYKIILYADNVTFFLQDPLLSSFSAL